MRRYLIVFLAIIFSIGLFFLTKYILSKVTKNNQIFYSTLVSVIGFCVFTEQQAIRIHAGKRYINLKIADLDAYRGKRAQRGTKLPRGFQKPDGVELLTKDE